MSFTHTENLLVWATQHQGEDTSTRFGPLGSRGRCSSGSNRHKSVESGKVVQQVSIVWVCFFFLIQNLQVSFNVFRKSVGFFYTVDATKLWFSEGLQPNQLWFEMKTSLVEVRAYSTSSQSGRSLSSYDTS